MTEKTMVTNINNLMDNWDDIKNNYTPGYFSNSNGGYKFKICWFKGDYQALKNLRVAFPSFISFTNGDSEANRNIDYVIRVGYLDDKITNTPEPQGIVGFVETRRHTSTISIKHYEHIDISKFDEYVYYSFLSSVIWKLRLENCISTNLTEEHFDYFPGNFIYVFLTGEEADYDKLSEEEKALVDLKIEEAKDFLKTIHSSIIEALKQMFKENS